jgi:5-methylcytosine-specific restriction endonuclease McrA
LHYQRVKRLGKLTVDKPHRPHRPLTGCCTVEGCELPDRSQGLCNTHYCRWLAHGDPEYTKRAARKAQYGAQDGRKRCSRCHEVKPLGEFFRNQATTDGHLPACKACSMAAERQRREADPQKARDQRRGYYAKNADTRRAKRREAYWRDPEASRAKNREFDSKRRDARREYDRTRREIRAEQCKAWRTPDRARDLAHRRRAVLLAAPQGDPEDTRQYTMVLLNDPCSYCGEPTEHIDHIQPLTRGGAHAWDNLTGACKSCNSRKHNKDLLTFLLTRENPRSTRRRAARQRAKQAQQAS